MKQSSHICVSLCARSLFPLLVFQVLVMIYNPAVTSAYGRYARQKCRALIYNASYNRRTTARTGQWMSVSSTSSVRADSASCQGPTSLLCSLTWVRYGASLAYAFADNCTFSAAFVSFVPTSQLLKSCRVVHTDHLNNSILLDTGALWQVPTFLHHTLHKYVCIYQKSPKHASCLRLEYCASEMPYRVPHFCVRTLKSIGFLTNDNPCQ